MHTRHHDIFLKIGVNEISKTDLVVVQYDNKSVDLRFYITNPDDTDIEYSSVPRATMVSKRPDAEAVECECVIEENYITYTLCYDETDLVGVVLSEIVLWGDNKERITTQQFRYIVIPTLAIDIDPSHDTNLPILQSLISAVTMLEANITNAEALRVIAENQRVQNNIQMNIDEANRKSNETQRQINESNRQDTMQSIVNSYNSIITQLTNQNCQMVLYRVNSLSQCDETNAIFKIPAGYDYDVTNVTILSHGDTVGLTALTEAYIALCDQDDNIIADKTYNDTTGFPASNGLDDLTIYPDFISENDVVNLKIVNDLGVVLPDFILQINYIVKLIE